jgi:Mg-chelatase subunit ChlD
MALPTRVEMKDDARKSIQGIIDELLEEYCSDELDGGGNEDPSDLEIKGGVDPNYANPSDLVSHDATAALLERLEGLVDFTNATSADVGWRVAQNYSYIRRQLKEPKLLSMAKKIAIRAIIARTLQLLGPTRRRMEVVREPYAPGQTGEIELELTTEEVLGKTDIDSSDLIIESNTPRRTACVLILDTSMSMSGDKLGIATASLGVLAFKLKSIEYGIIAFDNYAKPLKRLDQAVAIPTLLGDLLDLSAGGYTNLEDGLKIGLFELDQSKAKEKIGVIITDGNYTTGKDPSEFAAQYQRLFVIMMKSHDSKREVCARMASVGKGKLVVADSYDEIPSILRNLLRDFLYHSTSTGR